MGRVRIVSHRGTPIVSQDFSRVTTAEEGLRALDEARTFVERRAAALNLGRGGASVLAPG